MRKPVVFLAAIIFALVALAHLLRLIFDVSVLIGTWSVPMWLSLVGFVVPGVLAMALWRERG